MSGKIGEELDHWIDEHEEELVAFLREYISYRSPPEEEEEVQLEFVKPFFEEQMGWDEVEVVDVSEAGDRPNVNARLDGSGDGQNLLFNGHSDVVDVSDEEADRAWTRDPWDATVEDGRLYGRGANDMKGPNAAMIWAAKAVMECGVDLDGDLLMGITVGEEFGQGREYGATPSTEAFLENGVDPDRTLCLNTEQTHLEINNKTSFLFDFTVEIPGKKTHSSNKGPINYPQRHGLPYGSDVGVDAGSIMVDVVQRLEELEHDWNMKYRDEVYSSGGYPDPTDHQGVGRISLANCILEAGDYLAAVPGEARIVGNVYGPPFVDDEVIWEELNAAVEAVAATNSWLQENPPEMSWKDRYDWPAIDLPVDHPGCQVLGDAVESVTGDPPTYSGYIGVNDGSFIYHDCGIDALTFGPGHLSMNAHGADEYVPLDHLTKAAKIYARMIQRWCTVD